MNYIEIFNMKEKYNDKKNIIIYLHQPFNLRDGGATVQYYLAQVLSKLGRNVKIMNTLDNNATNSIYNEFINKNDIIDYENTVIIYCEGIMGNPLKGKYIVRWMLSKLGQNVPYSISDSWSSNELVYFFNSEQEIIDNHKDIKCLSLLFINPNIKNYHLKKRSGSCFTLRKSKQFHKNINYIHSPDSMEIDNSHTQDDYVDIFNNHEQFISYDFITFLNTIAALCGCISIVYPLEGVSKKDYYKKTYFDKYMVEKNIDSIYGIAYGNSESEIKHAKNTLHLVKEQIDDIVKWYIKTQVHTFLNDIDNWSNNTNTLDYYKDVMKA